jgi:predicted thioesterase
MTEQFPIGLIGEATAKVVPELTARHLGSGTVSVFATPEMVRLMERAAVHGLTPISRRASSRSARWSM